MTIDAMSCCKHGEQPSSDNALPISNEVQLWMDMMKYMLECTELTMAAIRDAKEKLKFSDNDLVRFNELCHAVDKVRLQLVSVGENFLKSANPDSVKSTKTVYKPALVMRKNCCMQVDDESRFSNHMKKFNLKKNACFCGKFKKKIVKKSKVKKIVVCSPVKNSIFLNQKCSRSFEIPKGEEPVKISEGLADDDNHPNIIKDCEKIIVPEYGIGWEFFYAMQRFSDRIAQYTDDTGEAQTFAELLKDCISVTQKLKEKNLGKENVVCICVSNHKYSCVPYLAATFAGCVINCLDVNSTLADVDYFLELVKPSIMFVQKEILPLIEGSLQKNNIEVEIVVIGGDVEGSVPFEEYLKTSDDEISNFRPQKVTSLQDTYIIVYTSGTSGDPKAVRLSHYAMLKQFFLAMSSGNFHRVLLAFSSYYGITTSILLGASILGGITRVVASQFDPKGIYRLIMKYKVDTVFIGTHECITLTRTPKPEDVDTSSLQVLATGGECLKASYLQLLRKIFPATSVFQIYGKTEAGLILQWNKNMRQHAALFNAKPASSGMPCGGTWYKIVEESSGKMLGPNQSGELCVKSDAIMEGLDDSGWLRTGDLAYYDKYHCFYIIDKLKEIITAGGKSISPSKLENILMEHPVVDRAVVFGLSDSNDEEVPTGLILLKPSVDLETIDFSEILEFVNKQVEDDQFLKDVRIVKKLPLTATGKVKRKDLKELSIQKNE